MNLTKSDWYLILFFLLAFVIVSLNELDYGIFALLLLYPAYLLAAKGFEQETPK